jgi:hypothetical protein
VSFLLIHNIALIYFRQTSSMELETNSQADSFENGANGGSGATEFTVQSDSSIRQVMQRDSHSLIPTSTSAPSSSRASGVTSPQPRISTAIPSSSRTSAATPLSAQTSAAVPSKRNRKDALDQGLLEVLQKKASEEELYGETVAIRLSRLPPQKRAQTKLKIDVLLFESEFGDAN